MNKKEYSKPVAEFVQFNNEDIITTSGCGKSSYYSCDGLFINDRGCIVAHDDSHCRTISDNAPSCGAPSILWACREASENGKPTDCKNNWTNWYSET